MSRYHTVLGVPKTATKEEIKKAYRRLILKYHPDITGGDPIKTLEFLSIKTAYEELMSGSTEIRRDNYAEVYNHTFEKNGDCRFYIRTENVKDAYPEGVLSLAYYWSFVGLTDCNIIISKKDLEVVDYKFFLLFRCLDGFNIRGYIEIDRPLTRWGRLLLILKTIFK